LGFVYGVDIAFGRVINSKFKFADGFQLNIALFPSHLKSDIHSDCGRNRVVGMEYLGEYHFNFSPNFLSLEQIPCIMAAATLAINVAYIFFESRLPKASRLVSGREAAKLKTDANQGATREGWFAAILAIPAAFWIITISQVGPNSRSMNLNSENILLVVAIGRCQRVFQYSSGLDHSDSRLQSIGRRIYVFNQSK
jgi:hypothetical protein